MSKHSTLRRERIQIEIESINASPPRKAGISENEGKCENILIIKEDMMRTNLMQDLAND